MAEVSISIAGDKVITRKLANFERALPGQIRKGFTAAGRLWERDMKRKLSGPGRVRGSTHGPVSRLGQFPGVVTGTLRRSVNYQVSGVAGGMELRVGPNVEYARYLELGTRKMKPYSFVRPSFEDKADEAIDLIQREIMKPLDR